MTDYDWLLYIDLHMAIIQFIIVSDLYIAEVLLEGVRWNAQAVVDDCDWPSPDWRPYGGGWLMIPGPNDDKYTLMYVLMIWLYCYWWKFIDLMIPSDILIWHDAVICERDWPWYVIDDDWMIPCVYGEMLWPVTLWYYYCCTWYYWRYDPMMMISIVMRLTLWPDWLMMILIIDIIIIVVVVLLFVYYDQY